MLMASVSNPDPTSGAQCIFCDAISRMIKTPRRRDFDRSIRSHEVDALSRNCKEHEPLLEAALNRDPFEEWMWLDTGVDRDNLVLEHPKRQSMFSVWAPGHGLGRLELVRRDDVPGHYGKGSIVEDKAWINLSTIRGFIENCKAHHGNLCEKYPFGNSFDFASFPKPAYLVDVEEACLVNASTGRVEYLTLACAPGDTDDYLITTTDNLASLQVPGCLTGPELSPRLARTFKDAIELTALLGYRYLWIDHLCVIRNDVTHRRNEQTKAGFIFSGADFCIAECNGKDPHYGIRGIRELRDPQPRSFDQLIYPFTRDGEVFIRPTSVRPSRAASLADRQRRETGIQPKDMYDWQAGPHVQTVLSRRTLRFDRDTVNFACKSYAGWEKDIPQGLNAHMWEDNAHTCDADRFGCQMDKPRLVDEVDDVDITWDSNIASSQRPNPHWSFALAARWPAVEEYFQALVDITRLVVPKDTDVLDLTAPVAAAFSLRFEGRFIAGLPESCFDTALLWQIKFRGDSARVPGTPSWSWAGWTGTISPDMVWRLDHVVAKSAAAIETTPTVSWSAGDDPSLTASQRQPIQCRKWFEAREAFQDATKDVPPGWTRLHRRVRHAQCCPKGYNPDVQYHHDLAPDKSFWYPIPMVTTPDATAAADRQTRPRYLFGTTERSTVYISRGDMWGGTTDEAVIALVGVPRRKITSGQPSHVLRDGNGAIVGVLQSHADVADALYGAEAPERTAVELLTISRGRAPQNDDVRRWINGNGKRTGGTLSSREDPKWSEYWNVIWVEWHTVDGVEVAERKGLGRVGTEQWESLDRTMVGAVLA